MMRFFLVALFFSIQGGLLFSQTEIPFKLTQTGQILIQCELNNNQRPAYFYLETNGKNMIRSDQPSVLKDYGLLLSRSKTNQLIGDITNADTIRNAVYTSEKIKEFKIGNHTYHNIKFLLRPNLQKRGERSFPKYVLGTINVSMFKKQVIRLDFKSNTLTIADDHKLLSPSDSTVKTGFRNSFASPGVYFNVETRQFGTKELALDTRSPLGIHLFYSGLSLADKTRYRESFQYANVKLDGENDKLIAYYNPHELFLEDYLVIRNQNIWLSDYIPNSIGNAFLKHFIVTIDFKNNEIYFDAIDALGKSILSYL